MKRILSYIIISFIFLIFGWYLHYALSNSEQIITVREQEQEKPPDLSVYSIELLSKTEINSGTLKVLENISEEDKYKTYLFKLNFEPNPKDNEEKYTTGQLNIPIDEESVDNKYPIILMLRGYIDQETYKTGDGSRNAAKFFANNGFLTIAPDFLGYASSDKETGNIFESRFQTYVTAISLIKSLGQIEQWDKRNVFIWAHSNGGQIALTSLEITGGDYPTALWAPVTKPFPYSVLYYTDESEDGGKLIRAELAKFEEVNDPYKFSLTNYIDRIQAPILLQQGLRDNTVPPSWSQSFYNNMEKLDKDIEYLTYTNSDHNMSPEWNNTIEDDLAFFKDHMKD